MKKTNLLLLVIGFLLVFTANSLADSWVITKDGRIDCKQIRIRIKTARIIQQDGNEILIPLDQISSYSQKGRIYTKLCLYRYGKSCQKMVFMEQVKNRGIYSLYKFRDLEVDTTYDSYYIYNGNEFC